MRHGGKTSAYFYDLGYEPCTGIFIPTDAIQNVDKVLRKFELVVRLTIRVGERGKL
jgi:hypothetical protein